MSSKRQNARNVVTNFEKDERRRNLITFGVIGAVVLLMIGGVIWSISSNKVEKAVNVVEPAGMTKDYGIVYTSKDAGGDATENAKARITIWEDFSCPFCQLFEEQAGDELNELVKSGDAEIEYRVVGFLDDGAVVNNHSKRAASAALCVKEDNGVTGWKTFHDWLYDNQPEEGSEGQTNVEFVEAAEELGLTVDAECVRSEKYVPYMQEATDNFNESNVGGTPTVLVNDEKVESDIVAIKAAVEAANS